MSHPYATQVKSPRASKQKSTVRELTRYAKLTMTIYIVADRSPQINSTGGVEVVIPGSREYNLSVYLLIYI